jgi:hypothetical protein
MKISSHDLIDVTNEVGISGKFLKLARNGRLVAVSGAIQNRAKIAKELAEVEGKLNACNDPATLSELAIWCSTRRGDFGPKLKKLAANLEYRKCRLLAALRGADQRLHQDELSLEWDVDPTALMTSLVPRLVRKSDQFVAERNEVIDRNLNLTHEEICRHLDQELGWEGRECGEHLPKTWVLRYRIDSFLAAYRHPKCRNLVHKLISVRRRLASYSRP